MKIENRDYIKYKFFNSLFLGISIGSIFTIYATLSPSFYSVGGVVLALFMLIVAKYYHKILNIKSFYQISLFVEVVLLFIILYFLIFSYSYTTSVIVYSGYQITFIFGAYLVRAETLFIKKRKILSFIDVNKQKAYLAGMFISFLFYKIFEYYGITDNKFQVLNIHYLLFGFELVILYYLRKAFR
jgi:hypothetical protein